MASTILTPPSPCLQKTEQQIVLESLVMNKVEWIQEVLLPIKYSTFFSLNVIRDHFHSPCLGINGVVVCERVITIFSKNKLGICLPTSETYL